MTKTETRKRIEPPTKAEIKAYKAIDAKRRRLFAQAYAASRETEQRAARLTLFVKQEAGRKKHATVEHEGFCLSIVDGQVRPAWKDEFIAKLGEVEAQLVIDHTAPAKVLTVERVNAEED